jgi:GNAT superfamily N-acetyltransferase
MAKAFCIRLAESGDVPALVALVNSAYRGNSSRKGWTTEADLLGGQRVDRAMIRRAIRGAGRRVLVLERAGECVGCVALERHRGHGYIGLLTVRPDLQARGLGKRLLSAAERWVRSRWKLRRVRMMLLIQRSDLLAYYVRRGYRDTGRRRPFPYGDERFGLPKISGLKFAVLEKALPFPVSSSLLCSETL